VMTTGGSGSFNYRWSGEGVAGQTGPTIFTSYNTTGNRTVQVAVRDTVTNNEVTTACSTQILASTVTPTPSPFRSDPISSDLIRPIAQCPPGTVEKSRSGNQLVCEAQNRTNTTVVQGGIAQCPAGTIEKNRTGSQLICETQNPTTIVTAAASNPTSSPFSTTVVTAVQPVQCPSGTIEKSRSSSEIICERQVAAAATTNNIVVNPPAQTKDGVTVLTQSANPSVKELPKTGLPLAAVGLASLTPLGLRVKRLLNSRVQEESANDLWVAKQLKQ
jgi:hypothetical protein